MTATIHEIMKNNETTHTKLNQTKQKITNTYIVSLNSKSGETTFDSSPCTFSLECCLGNGLVVAFTIACCSTSLVEGFSLKRLGYGATNRKIRYSNEIKFLLTYFNWFYKRFSIFKTLHNDNFLLKFCHCVSGWRPSVPHLTAGTKEQKKVIKDPVAESKKKAQELICRLFPCKANGFTAIRSFVLVRLFLVLRAECSCCFVAVLRALLPALERGCDSKS